jgi:release factor glutamine methyltransferase
MMKSEIRKAEVRRMKDEGALLSSFSLQPSAFEVLRQAALILADTDSPRLTAEALLTHALGVTRTQLLSWPERIVPPQALSEFQALIARAAAGEPLAYLTGHREFYGLDFLVDARVLVPRPETELLIDLALSPHHPVALSSDPLCILEVGTGSGCIAITLAVRLPSALITALDISADALTLACLNAERHLVADRLTFLQSDLFSNLQPRSTSLRGQLSPISNYHLLIANLPYIPSADLRRLPVLKPEPALALDGGPDGLDLIRRLLADAPRMIAPHSRLLLEINDEKSAETFALALAAFPAAQVELHQDFAGLDRAISITL